jgi:hypothetical protein
MRTKTFYFFLLSILFLSKNFSEDEKICYFIPPKDFKPIDTSKLPSSKTKTIGYVGKAKNLVRPSINLTYEKIEFPFEEYLKIVQEQRDQDLNSTYKDFGKIKTSLGEAYLCEINNKTQVGDMRLLQAIWFKENYVFVMTSACLKEDVMIYYKDFLKSFSSLTIENKSSK